MQDPLDDPRYGTARDMLLPVWDQLGRALDRTVAKQVGLPTLCVARIRELARIAPVGADRARFLAHVAPLAPRWAAVRDLPDMDIAQRVGVRYSAVVLYRALDGLPPQAPPPEPWQGAVGLFDDAEIARRARIGVGRVTDVRRQLGISRRRMPYWSGPARWDDLWDAAENELHSALATARSLPEAPLIRAADPRFRAWFLSIGSPAPTLELALADYPEAPLIRSAYHLRALLERITACKAMSLDEEMRSLIASVYDERRRTAMLELYALHGGPPRRQTAIAAEFNVGQPAVSHWGTHFDEAVAERPWLPTFDGFLAAIEGGPRDDERLAALARDHGSVGLWPAAVVEAVAERLKRTVTFVRARMGSAAAALTAARHGPFTAERARETLANEGFDLSTERVLALAAALPGVEWVLGGPPDGWFWFPDRAERSVLVYAIRKLVAVGPVAASEVVEGVRRRNRPGRERVEVPPAVAAAVAARLPGLVVHHGVIDAAPNAEPRSGAVLTDPERAVVAAFERQSPVLTTAELTAACVAAGLDRHAARSLQYSPVLRGAGPGRAALRSSLRGRPPFTDLRALAELALAMARPEGAIGLRVAGGTWSWKELGEDVAAELREFGRGADAWALVHPRGRGWAVVAERPGERVAGWGSFGKRALELGRIVRTETPL